MRPTLLALLLLVGCSSHSASSGVVPVSESCGESVMDWCTRPGNDACSAHMDEPSCRADSACEAVPYRGESMVACIEDERCFAANCPAVGCVTRCERLDAAHCGQDGDRCRLLDGHCQASDPCGPEPAGADS